LRLSVDRCDKPPQVWGTLVLALTACIFALFRRGMAMRVGGMHGIWAEQ
jgi:hypothetical protein